MANEPAQGNNEKESTNIMPSIDNGKINDTLEESFLTEPNKVRE